MGYKNFLFVDIYNYPFRCKDMLRTVNTFYEVNYEMGKFDEHTLFDDAVS